VIVCPTCHWYLYGFCNFCECGYIYDLVDFRDYCKRAHASGWDGISLLVYGSVLPERKDGAKVPKKKEVAFKLTNPEDPRVDPDAKEAKEKLEGWEWARIRKKNKKILKLKAMQTTLNFDSGEAGE
jgi:hypothetical protein|tara:strand:- start:3156 stop:3533 length:378 start_codon:yes stop_codon:yes gene_type:complete